MFLHNVPSMLLRHESAPLVADTIYCTMWESLRKEISKPKYRVWPAIGTLDNMIRTIRSRGSVLTPCCSPRTVRPVESEDANYASTKSEKNLNTLPASRYPEWFIDWYYTNVVI